MRNTRDKNNQIIREIVKNKTDAMTEFQLKEIYLTGLRDGLRLGKMTIAELVSLYGDQKITEERMLTQ